MENLKRPTKSENDDDLQEQQRKFLKEIKNPSAKCVSHCSRLPTYSSEESHEELPNTEKSIEDSSQKNLEVVTENLIFDVKETDVYFNKLFVFKPPPLDPKEMSEKLINLNVKLSDKRKLKGQSIFAQLLSSSANKTFSNEDKEYASFSTLVNGSGLDAYSKDTEMKKIHEESLEKLSSMSKEEILHHQNQLKNYLKPEILNFIKRKKEIQKDDHLKCNKIIVDKHETDLPAKLLRREGKEDCDAVILDKIFQSESHKLSSQNTDTSFTIKKQKKDTNIEIPMETAVLLEGREKGLWRNMNKIEKDKLEWMTNLPQPKLVDLKTGYGARFDFEGKLLSPDADIPTYEGLHHHGNEPEVPGYSLEELCLLARSSLQSQRITALNTIAHILENNWYGMMDTCFETPLLPLLLNAGIVPLLRWALDDTSLTSVSATISAIHSLLISKADEACSNKTFCWLNGHFVAQLEPQGLIEPNIVIENLTDADLIKLDVVKGFLRIDILPRFMYILKVMCPPPLVCRLIIEICARLAQHSPEAANKVATYPGFLNLIFEKFLPLNWNFIDSSVLTDTVNYSCPMYSALKMIRIIISSNKELAQDLIKKHDVVQIITFYLTVQPCDRKLPPQEVQLLVIETLKIWHSFLCYGLAINIFLDLFPIFLKQLEFCRSLNINSEIQKHIQDFDYATHLFKAFEAVTIVASEESDRQELASAVAVVFREALPCLRKWIWQVSQETTSSHGMTLLAACMNFIVTDCKKFHGGLICENCKPCSTAKDTFEECLLPVIKSNFFHNMLKGFRSFSLYLNAEISGNKRDGETIVSLGSVLYGADIVPILKEESPLPLLSAIFSYIHFYVNSYQCYQNECIKLACSPILNYLQEISMKKLNKSCWFLKFEVYFIYQLVQLASILKSNTIPLCYNTAASILTAFTFSEECLLEDLFKTIIFNESIIPHFTECLESNQAKPLHLLTSRLPVIVQCYISCFLNGSDIRKSRNMLSRSSNIDSLFCLSTPSKLVPKDWCFMPIFHLYQKAKERKGECLTPEEILQITSSLEWIASCHNLKLPMLKTIPATAQFYYLCLVFLLDENLFRDQKVKDVLVECATFLLSNNTLKLNNNKKFDNIYLEMLIQYESVSYGDQTFGKFLTICLQQCYPTQWKKLLLSEHLPVLRFLRVPLLDLLVPIQNFLEPFETDIGLLCVYFKVLASGTLDHIRCPLFYLMAVHHIHNFVFAQSESHTKDKKLLLLKILNSRKDLQRKILLYLKANECVEYGFTMAEELSSERKKYVCDITGLSVNL